MTKILNFTIIKEELRKYRVLIISWTLLFSLYALFMGSFFDSFKDLQSELDSFLGAFPEGFLEAFGGSVDIFSTFEGFFNTEFASLYMFAVMILGVYLGTSIIRREITNRTIHFLIGKPISFASLLISKLIGTCIVLFIPNAIIALVSYFASQVFITSGEVAVQYFFTIFAAMYGIEMLFMSVGLVLSVFIDETKTLLLGVGSVFTLLIIDTMSSIGSAPEFLQYLTPYHYLDLRHIADNKELLLPEFLIFPGLFLLFVCIAIWKFRKMDVST